MGRDDDTPDETMRRTSTPAAGPNVEDIVQMVDSLTTEERTRLLRALRGLYGTP